MASASRKSLATRAGAVARNAVQKVADQVTPPKPEKATRAAGKTAATKSTRSTPAVEKRAATSPAKKAATTTSSTARRVTTTPAKKKASVEKTATTKTAATKAPAKKTATKAAAKAPAKAPAKKAAAEQPTVEETTAAAPAAPAAELIVLEQEDPWSKAELKTVRTQLLDDVSRLTGELAEVEGDLAGMIENSGEGAGHDQADVGSASFERDQEMVIVHNARDMLEQSQHALERIANGTYGQCEVCGNAIGKNRLMAFPRATLCLTCKQREERR